MRIEVIQRMVVRARTVNPNVVPGAIVRLLEEMAAALEVAGLGDSAALTAARLDVHTRCIAALCPHCAAGDELLVTPDWFGHVRDGRRICVCPARLLHGVRV